MTEPAALFSLDDITPADEPDPKGMRELLFSGLIAELAARIADTEPDFIITEHMLDDDGNPRSGSAWWQARQRAAGLREALAMARSRLMTHKEYLIAEREWTRRSWAESERECARHRDACPHCIEGTQFAWRTRRELERLERVRVIHVQGIHDLIAAAGDTTKTVTPAALRKGLQLVATAAAREWRKADADG